MQKTQKLMQKQTKLWQTIAFQSTTEDTMRKHQFLPKLEWDMFLQEVVQQTLMKRDPMQEIFHQVEATGQSARILLLVFSPGFLLPASIVLFDRTYIFLIYRQHVKKTTTRNLILLFQIFFRILDTIVNIRIPMENNNK